MENGSNKVVAGYQQWEADISLVEEPSNKGLKGHKDLWIWKEGMELAKKIYKLSDDLPSDERFGLKSQLRRAAVSVPSNIAEGWGRNKKGYFSQHLKYARGSLLEIETQLILATELDLIDSSKIQTTLKSIGKLSAGIMNLMKKLEDR